MLKTAFFNLIYEPLYNGLVFLVDVVPAHDMGIAVIILTIVVKVILAPLSRQAIRTQVAMRSIAPEVEAIKEKFKDKQEEQARAIFALYRERNIRPFATFFLIFLQLPILFGLYWVFWKGGLPEVNTSLLYSFVPPPERVNMDFLGLINMSERSLFLAILTGLTQYTYTRLSMGKRKATAVAETPSFSSDMARSFDIQARYVLPLIFAGISYTLAAALPLYWATSNIFMIGQELVMGRRLKEDGNSEKIDNSV
jgi:YidC/Oxa1 family membrane protein insertase